MLNEDRMLHRDNLNTLPAEVLLEIFSYLCPEMIANIATVNKHFRIKASDNYFWRMKFNKHFPHAINKIKINENTNWYTEFRQTYYYEYKELPVHIRKLFSLVKEGDLERLIVALNTVKKFDLNSMQDIHYFSLLDWAMINEHPSIAHFFYQRVSRKYQTRMAIHTPTGSKTIIKFDTTKTDNQKRNILVWAILCYQSVSEINSLIFKNAQITSLSNYYHPLLLAAKNGQADIVELLIKKGAYIDSRSASGATALLHAIERGHRNVIDILLKYHANITIPLLTSSAYHDSFDIHANDTPLHAAIKLGYINWSLAIFAISTSPLIRNKISNTHQTHQPLSACDLI